MLLRPVVNVFYFVDDLDTAATWYSARLDRSPAWVRPDSAVFELRADATLTLHVCDEYNAGGPGGPVPYWDVDDVDAVVDAWTRHGATAHRAARTLGTGERLCQLLDPFGNLVGLRQAAVVPPRVPAGRVELSPERLRAAERTANDWH